MVITTRVGTRADFFSLRTLPRIRWLPAITGTRLPGCQGDYNVLYSLLVAWGAQILEPTHSQPGQLTHTLARNRQRSSMGEITVW